MGFRRAAVLACVPFVKVLSEYTLSDDTTGQRKKGCESVTAGTKTFIMTSNTACSGRRCPPCFMFSSGPVQLTLTYCGTNQFLTAHSVQSLIGYRIVNTADQIGTVSDGTNIFVVAAKGRPGSSISCWCTPSNVMYCDASVTPVMFTAAMNSATDQTACMSVDSTAIDSNSISCSSASGCTIDFSLGPGFSACGYKYCAPCFFFDSSSADLRLTISQCSYFRGLDQTNNGVILFRLAAKGGNKVTISDGTTSYIMQGGSGLGFSKALCICENDLLHCSVPTARLNSESKGIARFPENVRVGEELQFAGSYTYAKYDSGLTFYVQNLANTGSSKSITLTSDGGTLHGSWTHEASMTMSDKRLKTSIEPVGETLRRYLEVTTTTGLESGDLARPLIDLVVMEGDDKSQARPSAWNGPTTVSTSASSGVFEARANSTVESLLVAASDNASVSSLSAVPKWDKSTDKDPVLWILDRLKPVSYVMKRNKAAGRRFGFIADDLEEILPDIVHVDPQDEARLKRVHMMDLLSILAAASQRQQQRIEELERRHGDLEKQVALLTSRFEADFTSGRSARV
eukprot:TRINITY_DN43404_c0_g1_i1.p1 TRINITY_DN43404_c0_g1~~TRINITY_DN43404_c0_g1_i1.p1  ORF type:complete len:571 (+),score=84.75 TRINITY_DN43404_c0_g1_i1:72-1784(+)